MLQFFIAIVGLYLFMICPKLTHRNNMELFCKTPLAHRGIHDNKDVPENSLKAFKAAVEAGCGIELDVQFTRDMKLVVFHDENLKRMCGDDRLVIDVDYDELSKMRLMGTDEKIPLLSEVLGLVDGKVPLLIEMKNELRVVWEMPRALYGIMKDYSGVYAIESFNPMFIRKYRKLDKTVARGVLSMKFTKEKIKKRQTLLAITLENLMWNFMAKPDFIAYRVTDYNKISLRLNHLLGATAVAWGVPEPALICENMKKHFDCFICDMEREDDAAVVEGDGENVTRTVTKQ
ncbi:MAG: glycerophosphodiester phosphodiesterase family protein [Eubacteriales bacterium]